MAIITFMEGHEPVDPGFGVGAPVYPSTGPIYGGGHPSHGLPGLPPGAVTLPVFPFDPTDPGYGVGRPDRPDNSLPGQPPQPDNSLPGSGARPDQGLPRPGMRYVVKYLACVGMILVPDNSLPATPEPK